VVLFELITETRPFEAPTPSEIFDLILGRPVDTGTLVRLGVPSGLVDLIRAATEKDPAQRPQDFGEVVRRIDEVLDDLAARNRRRKLRWLLIAAFALLSVIAAYFLLRSL